MKRNNNDLGSGVRRAPNKKERAQVPARRENQQQRIDRIFRVIDTTIHERRGFFADNIHGNRGYFELNMPELGRSMAEQMGFEEGELFHRSSVVNVLVQRDYFPNANNPNGLAKTTFTRQYFRVGVNAVAEDVANAIIKGVIEDDRYEDDYDTYDTQIVGYKIEDELPEDFGNDLLAYHQFQEQELEKIFALRRLQLRDFSCIYESLMVILYFIRCGAEPIKFIDEWAEFVLFRFNQESIELQNIILDGRVKDALKMFCDNYRVQIGVFNAYYARQELQYLEELMAIDESKVPKFYLVYWQEHVFPASYERLSNIKDFICNRYENIGKRPKIFSIIPPYYWTLKDEVMAYMLTPPQFQQDAVWTLKDAFRFTDEVEFISVVKQARSNMRYEDCQLKVRNDISNLRLELEYNLNAAAREINLALKRTGESIVKYMIDNGKIKDQSKAGVHFLMKTEANRRMLAFHTSADQPWVAEKIVARKRQFDEIGLAGFDIEACQDTSLEESSFVFRPYMASIYGKLQQIYTNSNGFLDVRLVDVDMCFVGMGQYDCISKFVEWLVANKHMWTDYDVQSMRYKVSKQKILPRLFNYIFAHNGFGFDYLYVIEKLHMQCKEFQLVGDANHMKCLQGGGLFFYDFFLIYKKSLKSLAATFFKGNADLQKLDTDNIELTVEQAKQWCADHENDVENQDLKQMIEYNRRDSVIVYKLAHDFFRFSFTTPFGHAFLPKMFYHSLSSLSWDMWQTCFLKSPIFVNRHTHDIEKKMKIGGLCLVYRQNVGMGLVIDFNSFYPSIMKNMMPLEYQKFGADAFEQFDEPIVFTREDPGWKLAIQHHSIYKIKYCFAEDEKLPTIVQKGGDSLVIVQKSLNFETDDALDSVYVFGETIRLAIEVGAKIKVFGTIRFKPGHVHNDFVDYMYTKRLEAKRKGDDTQVQFYKDVMNMCFGKHGQNTYQQSKFGTWSTIREWRSSLMMRKDVVHDSISIKPILCDKVPLFEMKYDVKDQDLHHKGATLRISAFIMEMARTHLMRVKHKLAEIVGADSICYCDTDSIMISLDKCEVLNNNFVQTQLMIYKSLPVDERLKREGEFVKLMTEFITETDSYKKIMQLKVKDVTNLASEEELPLIDDNRLGACKIEKLMINGLFMGQKQYGIRYIENGKIKETVKTKGIPEKYRDMLMIDRLQFQTDEEGNSIPPLVYQEVTQFRRAGAGVNIFPLLKIIKSTLYKRNYDFADCTSMPWENIEVYEQFKQENNIKGDLLKEKFKKMHEEAINLVKQSKMYIASRESNMKKMLNEREIKAVSSKQWFLMIESRKRFMMQLPKFKYDRLQDKLITVLQEDDEVKHLFMKYMVKTRALCAKAVIMKKKNSKEPVSWWVTNQEFKNGKFESLYNNDIAGTIIAFTLFCYMIARKRSLLITEQFHVVCVGMSKLLDIFASQRDDQLRWWRRYILFGFQFLSAPVSIDGDERYIGLDQPVRTTNLWRYMNNLLCFNIEMQQMGSEVLIETDKKDLDLMFKIGQLRRAEYDDRFFRFNFMTDVPIDDKGVPILKEVDTEEDRVRLQDYNQLLPFEKPVLLQVNDEEEAHYYKTRTKYIARSLISQLYSANRQLYKQEDIEAVIDNMFCGFKPKQVDDVKRYFSIFEMRAGKDLSQKQVTAMDVIDYILVCQFLYFGGDRACAIYRAYIEEWKRLVNDKNVLTKMFKNVSELIFQRSGMFGTTLNKAKKETNAKIGALVEGLFSQIIYCNFGEVEMDGDERDKIIRRKIEDIVNDKSICTNDFRNFFRKACFDQECTAFSFGKQMCDKILEWCDPENQLNECLQNILFISQGAMVRDSGNAEMISEDDRHKLIMENIARIKQNTNDFRQQIMDKYYFRQRERDIVFQNAIDLLKDKRFEQDEEVKKEADRLQKRENKRVQKEYEKWRQLHDQFLFAEEEVPEPVEEDNYIQDEWLLHDEHVGVDDMQQAHRNVEQLIREVQDEEFARIGKRLHQVMLGSEYDSGEESLIMARQAKRQKRYFAQEQRIGHLIEAQAEEGEEASENFSISDFLI